MQACRHSLSFRTLYARRDDTARACPRTCDWLFTTAEFQKWRDRSDLPTHNGVLWIKGKPGAGKLTLMKHTLRHCQTVFKDHFTAAYFFHARGDTLEKTPLDMLRSVICQLLDNSTVYEHFIPLFREKRKWHQDGGWEWRQSELEEFLLSESMQREPVPLLLFVDALDECNDSDVRDVVGFLESLSRNAVGAGVALNICLSSRHYPYINMGRKLDLTVETRDGHSHDIDAYVSAKLILRDDDIDAGIRKNADGVFMWVVLVVAMLNQAYDDGEVEAMQATLDVVPGGLEELFDTLLSKHNARKAETTRMLQWVLWLLKPDEVFVAAIDGAGSRHLGSWDRSKYTSDTIQRRITSSSRGLIEIRRGATTTVQFIHQSVNDFLLRNTRLQTLDPTLGSDPMSARHGRLWAFCRSSMEQVDMKSRSEERTQELADNHPFLGYAAGHTYDHAEKALSRAAVRDDIIQWLQQRHVWFEWWKIFLNTCDTGSYLRDDMDAGLLHVFSLCGHQYLARVLLGIGGDINAQGGFYGNALQAASGGYEATVDLLLGELFGRKATEGSLGGEDEDISFRS